MTWGIDPDTGEIWEDDPVFTGVVKTIDVSDGVSIPDDVTSVMSDIFRAEVDVGDSPVLNQRAGYILMDWIEDDIVVETAP